jgi:hypothetical protein
VAFFLLRGRYSKGGDPSSLPNVTLPSYFYFKEEPIMKKIGLFILSFILCLGPLSIAMAQQPTICAIHPFTGRFAFAGIEEALTEKRFNIIGQMVNIRTMWGSLPLNGFTPSIRLRLCLDRAQG